MVSVLETPRARDRAKRRLVILVALAVASAGCQRMVGDSITLRAFDELRAAAPELAVDGSDGRGIVPRGGFQDQGFPTTGLEAIADAVSADDEPQEWLVIALGTNDIFKRPSNVWRADIRAALALVPRARCVAWVTIWARFLPAQAAIWNRLVTDELAQRDCAALVPWHSVAPGLSADGIHPTPAGEKRFASLVAEAVARPPGRYGLPPPAPPPTTPPTTTTPTTTTPTTTTITTTTTTTSTPPATSPTTMPSAPPTTTSSATSDPAPPSPTPVGTDGS